MEEHQQLLETEKEGFDYIKLIIFLSPLLLPIILIFLLGVIFIVAIFGVIYLLIDFLKFLINILRKKKVAKKELSWYQIKMNEFKNATN